MWGRLLNALIDLCDLWHIASVLSSEYIPVLQNKVFYLYTLCVHHSDALSFQPDVFVGSKQHLSDITGAKTHCK